ncbi:MAG: hypothetical protein VB089_22455 [Anaerolineaceae bacterium]|nr:hypothetical protein [Anaerolineaceae bacterium]
MKAVKLQRGILATGLSLSFLLAACSPFANPPLTPPAALPAPTQSGSLDIPPVPLSTVALPPPPENCASPVPAGHYLGAAILSGSGGWRNTRVRDSHGDIIAVPDADVLTQQGRADLDITIACDGSVNGTAHSVTSAHIDYNTTGQAILSASCTSDSRNSLSGSVTLGAGGQPQFNLQVTVTQGEVRCSWTSAVPEFPSGSNTDTLAGKSFPAVVSIDSFSQSELRGAQWTEDNLQPVLEQYVTLVENLARQSPEIASLDIALNLQSPWLLTRQP